MSRTKKKSVTDTTKIEIPFTPASGTFARVFTRQEKIRNTTKAALFGDSEDSDGTDCEEDEIEFEIQDEEDVDERSQDRLNQMVIARMVSGAGPRKSSSSSEAFQGVLTASGHASEDSEMIKVLRQQKCKSSAYSSVVKFLRKQNEYVYKFPDNERGLQLRECISRLCNDLSRDFEPTPEEMAKLLTQSLVSASGSSSLALNIFQQYNHAYASS